MRNTACSLSVPFKYTALNVSRIERFSTTAMVGEDENKYLHNYVH